MHAGEEEPWWTDHAAKAKHAAFLTRAGAPGMWLNILIHTAGPDARWGDAVHAARLLVAEIARADGDVSAKELLAPGSVGHAALLAGLEEVAPAPGNSSTEDLLDWVLGFEGVEAAGCSPWDLVHAVGAAVRQVRDQTRRKRQAASAVGPGGKADVNKDEEEKRAGEGARGDSGD